jgi:hypothetical protein
LPETVAAEQEPDWRRWSGEILADALAIVLGGAGFADYLSGDALLLGVAKRFREPNAEAVHPPFLVRVALLTAILRQTNVKVLAKYADQLNEAFMELAAPSWMKPYIDAAPSVANFFMTRKLDALKGHTILDFNPDLKADHRQSNDLAAFFLGEGPRPDPKGNEMHPRLVPAAGRLALRRIAQPTSEALARLNAEAVKYVDLIPQGGVLAGGTDRRQYFKDLMQTLEFPSYQQGA